MVYRKKCKNKNSHCGPERWLSILAPSTYVGVTPKGLSFHFHRYLSPLTSSDTGSNVHMPRYRSKPIIKKKKNFIKKRKESHCVIVGVI